MSEENKPKAVGHRWQKGMPSPNPGGRPKGLAQRLRDQTNDGQDVIDLFLNVAKGEIRATARDRLDAARWLGERMFGRVPEVSVNVNADATAETLGALADAHLERIARALLPSSASPQVTLETTTPPTLAANHAEVVDAEIEDN